VLDYPWSMYVIAIEEISAELDEQDNG